VAGPDRVDTLLERIGGGGADVPPRTKLADFSIVERESAPRT
jgi:hypothetical protein